MSETLTLSSLPCRSWRRYMHAATRHCYYQRATLQLLLRQLRFCAAELAGIRQKQLQIADIGVQYFNRWGGRRCWWGTWYEAQST